MPEHRSLDAYVSLAHRLATHPTVAAATAVEDGPLAPCVELVLLPGVERVPPGVHGILYRHDAGIRDVSPQGSPAHLVAEVV